MWVQSCEAKSESSTGRQTKHNNSNKEVGKSFCCCIRTLSPQQARLITGDAIRMAGSSSIELEIIKSDEGPQNELNILQTPSTRMRKVDASTSCVDSNITASTTAATNTNESVDNTPQKVWSLPWIVCFGMLYIFALFWVNYAILQRYLLQGNWGAALPGLDSTKLRKFTMGAHFTCGAIALLIGPFQFFPFLRRRVPWLHRWSGRLNVFCALLSSVFGCAFTGRKGKLVGGWNMSVAFCCAGITIGILAVQTWKTARATKESLLRQPQQQQQQQQQQLTSRISIAPSKLAIHFDVHRNWGIRSYSQILSPMLYRYWYVALELYGFYQGPTTPEMGGVCHADDTCPEYYRLFDQLHCWTYWLSSLLVAELIIYFLASSSPALIQTTSDIRHQKVVDDVEKDVSNVAMGTDHPTQETTPTISEDKPLLCNQELEEGSIDSVSASIGEEPVRANSLQSLSSSSSPWTVNLIGSVLAVATTAVTVKIFMD